MGSGDLNLKKSWHPGLMRNQEAVWKREQEALAERKKITERQKEIQRERERNELLAMQEAVTGKKRVHRMEWMYSGIASGSLGATDDAEAYLLGKKRIDTLFNEEESKGLKTDAIADKFSSGLAQVDKEPSAPVVTRDLGTKIREDPMMAIKRKQMEQAVNSQRQAHASSSSHDSRSSSSRSSHHSSRHEVRSRHHESSRRYHDSSRSRHDDSRSRRRDASPVRRSRRDYSDDESHHRRRDESSRSSGDHRSSQRRSKSPSHRFSSYRDSTSSRGSRPSHDKRSDDHREGRSSSRHNKEEEEGPSTVKEEERQRKLEEMMRDGKNLHEARTSRLKLSDDQEEERRLRDEKDRKRSSKYGGRSDFVHMATRDLLSEETPIDSLRRGMA